MLKNTKLFYIIKYNINAPNLYKMQNNFIYFEVFKRLKKLYHQYKNSLLAIQFIVNQTIVFEIVNQLTTKKSKSKQLKFSEVFIF